MIEEEKSKEELEKEFYRNLSSYFSERWWPTGFFNTVGHIRDHLETLNTKLEESSQSSSKLAEALNKLTFWGVIIACAGVLVAIGHLAFEIYKYSNGS